MSHIAVPSPLARIGGSRSPKEDLHFFPYSPSSHTLQSTSSTDEHVSRDQQSKTPVIQFTAHLIEPINRLDKILQDIIDYKLIRELISLLQTTNSNELQAETALSLQLLVKTRTGAQLIHKEMGIPVLVKMLQHHTEVIYTTALYILNQIMWHLPDETRPEVRACSGQLCLAELLREGKMNSQNWIVICLDSIRMVAYRDSDTKLSLVSTNLHNDLVRLLRTYMNHSKLAYNIARVIKVLGTCNENKAKLVESGAVEALTPLLHASNEMLQLETLWSLRNLSDQAFHLNTSKNLILHLIDLLASMDENISICAAGCLCNLTCENADNKGLVVESGGVTRLCQLLMLNPLRQEISEPVCSALRHVTHRSPYADTAVYEIRSNDALRTIVALLDDGGEPTKLPLTKSVIGLIRNLATEDESRELLRQLGTIKSVTIILKQANNTIQSGPMTLAEDSDDLDSVGIKLGCIEGVRLEDMLELCLVALQAMAKDVAAHEELVHTAGLLPTVVQLLYSASSIIQRAAVAFLSQLSASVTGSKTIEQEGACPRLTELVQSNNEYIAAYSAAVLHRIAQGKPIDYRRRLSLELRQALFDGGLASNHTGSLSFNRDFGSESISPDESSGRHLASSKKHSKSSNRRKSAH
ncbi:unnamed protein product [Dicrocoelium dendriticum]|nr:unnamed protein product [Dicrocoelium dendriticum]